MDRYEDPAPTRSQPGLLDQVRCVIRRLYYNYSIHTEQANVDWIRRFILFHGKRYPAEMGAPEGTVSPCSRIGSAGPFTGIFHRAVTRRGQVTNPRRRSVGYDAHRVDGNRDAREVLRI